MAERSPTLPFVVRQTCRVIFEKLAIRNIVRMAAQAVFNGVTSRAAKGRYRLVRGHNDERVPLLVGR